MAKEVSERSGPCGTQPSTDSCANVVCSKKGSKLSRWFLGTFKMGEVLFLSPHCPDVHLREHVFPLTCAALPPSCYTSQTNLSDGLRNCCLW